METFFIELFISEYGGYLLTALLLGLAIVTGALFKKWDNRLEEEQYQKRRKEFNKRVESGEETGSPPVKWEEGRDGGLVWSRTSEDIMNSSDYKEQVKLVRELRKEGWFKKNT